jgi:hypothetical protein
MVWPARGEHFLAYSMPVLKVIGENLLEQRVQCETEVLANS